MKVNRQFSLDLDVVESLNGINASELVNRLLKEHFAYENHEKTEEMYEILKKNRKKVKEIKQKMREIKEKREKSANILRVLEEEREEKRAQRAQDREKYMRWFRKQPYKENQITLEEWIRAGRPE